jgi:hypothetical protein
MGDLLRTGRYATRSSAGRWICRFRPQGFDGVDDSFHGKPVQDSTTSVHPPASATGDIVEETDQVVRKRLDVGGRDHATA